MESEMESDPENGRFWIVKSCHPEDGARKNT
jgi:hypothetical protein